MLSRFDFQMVSSETLAETADTGNEVTRQAGVICMLFLDRTGAVLTGPQTGLVLLIDERVVLWAPQVFRLYKFLGRVCRDLVGVSHVLVHYLHSYDLVFEIWMRISDCLAVDGIVKRCQNAGLDCVISKSQFFKLNCSPWVMTHSFSLIHIWRLLARNHSRSGSGCETIFDEQILALVRFVELFNGCLLALAWELAGWLCTNSFHFNSS